MLSLIHIVRSSNGIVRCRSALAATLTLAVLAGCGEPPATVKGLVTVDGKPLMIAEGMRGSVVFQPTTATGNTLTGQIDKTGHYQLSSGGSVTVTPSVYLVSVSATQLVPATEDRPSSGKRLTPAKYATATDSGFRVEVVPGENEVNLPLVSDPQPATTDGEAADDIEQPNRTSSDADRSASTEDTTPDDSTSATK